MIQANELRIGNLVQSKFGVHYVATPKMMLDIDKGVRKYFGAPLTEEWLLNFGFKKQGIYYFKDDFFGISDDLYEVCLWNDGEQIGYKNENIKYIHQLQNLYFALTNEELTVNL